MVSDSEGMNYEEPNYTYCSISYAESIAAGHGINTDPPCRMLHLLSRKFNISQDYNYRNERFGQLVNKL